MSRASTDDGTLPSLVALIDRIGPPETKAQVEAAGRLDQLTKPRGSLGRLEELAVTLAGITGVPAPTFARKAVVIFAADHGVAAQGVSAYPSEVTAAMVANFLAGGAAINVLAAEVRAEVVVVDVGVASPIPEPSTPRTGVRARLIRSRVRDGTRDLSIGPALERSETLAALEVGLRLADELGRSGVTIIAVGEMGIGNTTAASAIVAVLTGADARSVTGRGTGVDDATLERKIAAVERGRARLVAARPGPAPTDPLRVLDEVGGLEIAALCGFILGAAAARIPVVLDGFITSAAALLAARLCPALPPRLIAAHRSAEPGHSTALDALGLDPLLDLGLRLGEGSGAALALMLVEASCGLRDRMATFTSARVPGVAS
jgi:nicotinate-nucleotide--dimethylbenzimidazole phosphoribosyltransferase